MRKPRKGTVRLVRVGRRGSACKQAAQPLLSPVTPVTPTMVPIPVTMLGSGGGNPEFAPASCWPKCCASPPSCMACEEKRGCAYKQLGPFSRSQHQQHCLWLNNSTALAIQAPPLTSNNNNNYNNNKNGRRGGVVKQASRPLLSPVTPANSPSVFTPTNGEPRRYACLAWASV